MFYSASAVKSLHPGNFVKDSFMQAVTDVHPTFTWVLEKFFIYNLEIIGPFIVFLLSKFLIFFGIMLLARRMIREKFLYIFFIIFLFPYINYGITNSTLTINFPFAVPRMMSWGFFLVGFDFYLSKKYYFASVLWGLASLFHLQFFFLTFPLLLTGLFFFSAIHNKKKNFLLLLLPVIIQCGIAMVEIVSVYSRAPFGGGISNKDFYYFYIEKLFTSNFDPGYFLIYRLGIFLLLILPLFIWWRSSSENDGERMWKISTYTVIIGVVAYIIFVRIYFVKFIMLMWYPGLTQLITLTSVIFLISYVTRGWEKIFSGNTMLRVSEILFVYLVCIYPYIAPIFILVDIVRNKKILKIRSMMGYAVVMFVILILSPFSAVYSHKNFIYYVKPWSGIDFSMPKLALYMRFNTPKNSLFLTPPNIWYIQTAALRSSVVNSYNSGVDGYLSEWKKRMDEVVGKDIFSINKAQRDILYQERSLESILEIIHTYGVDYYITMNKENIKNKFNNEKSFTPVYWDDDYILYKINKPVG